MNHANSEEAIALLEKVQADARRIMDNGSIGQAARRMGANFRLDMCSATAKRLMQISAVSSTPAELLASLGDMFTKLSGTGNPKSIDEGMVAYMALYMVPLAAMATCLGGNTHRLAIVPIEEAADDV